MIVMHASLPVDPDSLDEAVSLATDLAETSRTEEGVVDYRVGADIEDETTLRFFERYADDAAVDAHMNSQHFQEFQGEIASHLAGEPTLTRFDVSESTQLM